MDKRIRFLLRKYSAEPTPDLAEQIVQEFLRTEPAGPLQWLTIPSEWEDEEPARVPRTVACPGCQHEAHIEPETYDSYTITDNNFLAAIETINEEAGLYRVPYECFCATGGVEGCDCKTPRTVVTWTTQTCAWCQKLGAVRMSGYGYALGPGAPLCGLCNPG